MFRVWYYLTSKEYLKAVDFAFDDSDPSIANPIVLEIHHRSGKDIEPYVDPGFRHEREVLFPRNIVFVLERRFCQPLTHEGVTRMAHFFVLREV